MDKNDKEWGSGMSAELDINNAYRLTGGISGLIGLRERLAMYYQNYVLTGLEKNRDKTADELTESRDMLPACYKRIFDLQGLWQKKISDLGVSEIREIIMVNAEYHDYGFKFTFGMLVFFHGDEVYVVFDGALDGFWSSVLRQLVLDCVLEPFDLYDYEYHSEFISRDIWDNRYSIWFDILRGNDSTHLAEYGFLFDFWVLLDGVITAFLKLIEKRRGNDN